MRGKKEIKRKRERGEKEKKMRKKLGTKFQKKKKKKEEVRAHVFPLRSRHFFDQSEIRYLEKITLYLILFACNIFSMTKLCDF